VRGIKKFSTPYSLILEQKTKNVKKELYLTPLSPLGARA